MSVTAAVLQRVKMSDGTYAIILPINTTDEVFVDIDSNLTLTTHLSALNVVIKNNRNAVIGDNLEIIKKISNVFEKPINLNNIYGINFSNLNNITLSSGAFLPGKIFI